MSNEYDKNVYKNTKLNKYTLIFLGVLILIFGVVLFILSDEIIAITVNQFTQQSYAEPLNLFFEFYTDLFIYIFIITLYLLGLLSFLKIEKLEFLKKWRPALIASVAAWAAVEYTNDLIKVIIQRPRPFEVLNPAEFKPVTDASGFSMPSGHSASAFATGIPLVFKIENILGKVIFVLYAILMAFSRVYVGVHWTSDVLIGSLLGLGVALTISLLYPWIVNRYENKEKVELIIWILAAVLGILWLIIFEVIL